MAVAVFPSALWHLAFPFLSIVYMQNIIPESSIVLFQGLGSRPLDDGSVHEVVDGSLAVITHHFDVGRIHPGWVAGFIRAISTMPVVGFEIFCGMAVDDDPFGPAAYIDPSSYGLQVMVAGLVDVDAEVDLDQGNIAVIPAGYR